MLGLGPVFEEEKIIKVLSSNLIEASNVEVSFDGSKFLSIFFHWFVKAILNFRTYLREFDLGPLCSGHPIGWNSDPEYRRELEFSRFQRDLSSHLRDAKEKNAPLKTVSDSINKFRIVNFILS